MPRAINLTGKPGASYDLDELKNKNTRTSEDEALKVQIWYWNPNLTNSHKFPNPPNPKIGQIWLSKKINKNDEHYSKIAEED